MDGLRGTQRGPTVLVARAMSCATAYVPQSSHTYDDLFLRTSRVSEGLLLFADCGCTIAIWEASEKISLSLR